MAGRIPQSFINDLIARLDIVDVVGSRVNLKKTGKNYSGLCPFHDEKTPSFSVSPDKQFFHCFGCKESGTALTFIMKHDGLEFVEAVEQSARELGLEVPREGGHGRSTKPSIDPALYELLGDAERFYRRQLRDAPQAIEYLKGRGLTGEVAKDFAIGYAPPGWQNLSDALPHAKQAQLLAAGLLTENDNGRRYDRFRERIMFPIRDTQGRVIGFGGRTLSAEDGPKYLNSPETAVFHKGSELYGLYEVRRALRRLDRVLVVEGYMDVVALAQFGVANAVATLGTATGEQHFRKLFRYFDEVVCCFDGDLAGRQAAWKALENALPNLNEHRQIKFAFLPDGEDPDTLIRNQGRDAFDTVVNNALPGLDFLVQHLSQGLDLNSIDGRGRLAGLIAPYVQRLPEGVLRELLQQEVARLTGLTTKQTTSATARPKPAARPTSKQPWDRLVDRLLPMVLKRPECCAKIDAVVKEKFLASAEKLGLFGRMMDYIWQHPEAETEELLVRFADEAGSTRLLQLAEKPSVIGDGDVSIEIEQGIVKIIDDIAREQQR